MIMTGEQIERCYKFREYNYVREIEMSCSHCKHCEERGGGWDPTYLVCCHPDLGGGEIEAEKDQVCNAWEIKR